LINKPGNFLGAIGGCAVAIKIASGNVGAGDRGIWRLSKLGEGIPEGRISRRIGKLYIGLPFHRASLSVDRHSESGMEYAQFGNPFGIVWDGSNAN
jgi:hypothetical protein